MGWSPLALATPPPEVGFARVLPSLCERAIRPLLASVCGWFTEGFDTRDLKEAKAKQLGS